MSGVRALSYYDESDIPFYYWLASEFSIADHYHCSLLGPTWPNRMYMYAAGSRGATGSIPRAACRPRPRRRLPSCWARTCLGRTPT